MGNDRRIRRLVIDDRTTYLWSFRHVRHLLSSADLAVGNLEFPVFPGAPPHGGKPFNGEPAYLDAIVATGAERAREVAAGTLADVYAKVGFLPSRPAAGR